MTPSVEACVGDIGQEQFIIIKKRDIRSYIKLAVSNHQALRPVLSRHTGVLTVSYGGVGRSAGKDIAVDHGQESDIWRQFPNDFVHGD